MQQREDVSLKKNRNFKIFSENLYKHYFWLVGQCSKNFYYQALLDTSNNKVIRPKSRASALSKRVRQTDRKTFFFKKTFEIASYTTKFLSTIQKHKKLFKKPLKQFYDRPTNRPTDGRTKRGIESATLLESIRVAQHATKK